MITSSNSIDFLFQEHVQHLLVNFSEILSRLRIDGLLIHSGLNRERFLDDQNYTFRVNPHFNYWVPLLENPNCFLWIYPHARPQLFYYRKTDFWNKMAKEPEGFWTAPFDIQIISDQEDVKRALGEKLQNGVYIGEWAEKFIDWGMLDSNREELLNEIHFLRTKKTPYEVQCLRRANERGAIGHLAAKKAFYEGYSEFEIQMDYVRALRVKEFDHPYSPIVALNENAGVLHYHDGQIERNEKGKNFSFLIDAGCGFHGYASDITRTYSFEKRGEFEELIQAMEAAQLRLINGLTYGTFYKDHHQKAHLEIGKILLDFDICRMPVEEMLEKKVTHAFFPHGLGHFLGLQVHDVEGFVKEGNGYKNKPPSHHSYFNQTLGIQPGHVFTIEPGLYFIPSLLDQLQKSEVSSKVNWAKINGLMKFGGIRIEDDIYAGEKGLENLTRDAFKMVEGTML